ncbi:MAG: hypothetical protein NUW12_12635 [Firmicutes bacterium]|nr:hypothetical protein [Bacillota bacterium]MDH7496707.1 hypothetical protein [Bacillota bacterium]
MVGVEEIPRLGKLYAARFRASPGPGLEVKQSRRMTGCDLARFESTRKRIDEYIQVH